MSADKIKCTCQHDFQDKKYGKQVRVATPLQGKLADGSRDVRCTVCSKVHRIK